MLGIDRERVEVVRKQPGVRRSPGRTTIRALKDSPPTCSGVHRTTRIPRTFGSAAAALPWRDGHPPAVGARRTGKDHAPVPTAIRALHDAVRPHCVEHCRVLRIDYEVAPMEPGVDQT